MFCRRCVVVTVIMSLLNEILLVYSVFQGKEALGSLKIYNVQIFPLKKYVSLKKNRIQSYVEDRLHSLFQVKSDCKFYPFAKKISKEVSRKVLDSKY